MGEEAEPGISCERRVVGILRTVGGEIGAQLKPHSHRERRPAIRSRARAGCSRPRRRRVRGTIPQSGTGIHRGSATRARRGPSRGHDQADGAIEATVRRAGGRHLTPCPRVILWLLNHMRLLKKRPCVRTLARWASVRWRGTLLAAGARAALAALVAII